MCARCSRSSSVDHNVLLHKTIHPPTPKPQNNPNPSAITRSCRSKKTVLRSHPSRGLLKKTARVGSLHISVSRWGEKKDPQLRGKTSARLMRTSVSPWSAPLVTQHVKHSQRGTKYIKVYDCYHRFTVHASPCTGIYILHLFSWRGVSAALEAKLCKDILSLPWCSDTGGLLSNDDREARIIIFI